MVKNRSFQDSSRSRHPDVTRSLTAPRFARAGLRRRGILDPSGHVVRDAVDVVAGGGDTVVQVVGVGTARIVCSRRGPEVTKLVDALDQAGSRSGALHAVTDHLGDGILLFRLWGRSANEAYARMTLHQTRVRDPIIRCTHVHAALAFLKHHRKDCSRIHFGFGGDGLDARLDHINLLLGDWSSVAKIRARLWDDLGAACPHALPRGPLVFAWIVGWLAAVALVGVLSLNTT